LDIIDQDVIISIAKVRSGKTVDWGHPILEHHRGIVAIKKTGNEPNNASKATVIEKEMRENEINNRMVKTLVHYKH
jgi:hypothetical protein